MQYELLAVNHEAAIPSKTKPLMGFNMNAIREEARRLAKEEEFKDYKEFAILEKTCEVVGFFTTD